MKKSRQSAAFTLLELLMVIVIIACLTALLSPAIVVVRQKAGSAVCMTNLRKIGIAGILYASEHDQKTPTIEPWPSQPVYSSEANAGNLLDVLKPYGVTVETLKCRSDINGPNYFAKEGSSYEWCPMANGQNVQAPRLTMGPDVNGVSIPMSRVLMAFDYTNVHNQASNVLFGDGHVAPAN